MAIINIAYDNYTPQHLDRSRMKIVAGRHVPYASVAEANGHPRNRPEFRYPSKTVVIAVAGENVEYWWKNGIDDEDLIPKAAGYTPGSNRINFTLTEDGIISLPADTDLIKLRVKNVAGLAGFYVGFEVGDNSIVSTQAIPAFADGEWSIFYCDLYNETQTIDLYVGGITSTTTLTFIKA